MAFFRPFRLNSVFTVLALTQLMSANVYAKLDVGVSSTNYLGQGSAGRQNSYSALDLGLDAKTDGAYVDSRALVQAEIGFNDSNYRFIEFPEAYLATPKGLFGPTTTTLGRKLVPWSALDDTWGAGAYEGRFRWDYLQPQEVGLIGLYEELKVGILKVTAMYSPIFIPDRGAPLDFSDGRIHSISPWAIDPPYEVQLRQKTVPVRYDAQIPPVSDIVRQNTFVTQLALGEEKGMWGAISYAYKPMNQLLLSYDKAYLTSMNDAHVTIYPRVAYHHVASMDIGARSSRATATLSGVADLPTEHVQFEELRTSQHVGNMYLVSPTLTVNPFGGANGGNLSVSYLRVFGTDPPVTGKYPDVNQFDSRYPYKSAFLLGAQFPTWRKLTTDFRLLFDIENPGTIVSWNFSYAADRDWRLFLATDVLSSFTGDSADGTDFIHRYRENDRVAGGVTYVF
jgi:hypothetical protein